MKNNRPLKVKTTSILIMLMIFMIIGILISHNTFAASDKKSKSPVKESETNRVISESIFTALADSGQVIGNEVFITHDDLINIPSIFCSAKGTALPGYESTVVSSGGKSTDTTDSGKSTGLLTNADKGETVFKNGATETESTTNPYSTTTSKTYGRFTLNSTRNATPAEAWVLNETNLNDPKINSISFTITDKEYTGKVKEKNKRTTAKGEELWAVEWDESSLEPTKYVTKKGEKYYYVTTDSYAPYTYVQHAWWKVKTVGTSNKSGVKDTDLAYEAEAFEEYINKIAVKNGQDKWEYEDDDNGSKKAIESSKWQYNDDTTFKVNYNVSGDSSNAEVRFNADTNKYIIGPFKINYLRAVTKQGTREKVSFSGISNCTMIATDGKGKELYDSKGESILKLGKNYRFVYDNEAEHEKNIPTQVVDGKKVKLDTAQDYPYPYDDENFYIELDYLEAVTSIKSINFDFQYMNAGATYEYLTGNYLIITWTPWYTFTPSDGSTSQSGASGAIRTTTNLNLAMNVSSRAGESSNVAKTTQTGENTCDNRVFIREIDELKPEDKNDEEITVTTDKCPDEDSIKIKVSREGKHENEIGNWKDAQFKVLQQEKTTYSYKNPDKFKYTITKKGEKNSITGTQKFTEELSIPKDKNVPIEELTITIKVTYTKVEKNYTRLVGIEETSEKCIEEKETSEEKSYTAKYIYSNEIADGININNISDSEAKFDGNTITYEKKGVVEQLTGNLEIKYKEGVESVKRGYIKWEATNKATVGTSIGNNSSLECMPDENQSTIKMMVYGTDENNNLIVTERYEFNVDFPTMYIDKRDCFSTRRIFRSIDEEFDIGIFNIYQYATVSGNYRDAEYNAVLSTNANVNNGEMNYRVYEDRIPPKSPVCCENYTYVYTDGNGAKVSVEIKSYINNLDEWINYRISKGKVGKSQASIYLSNSDSLDLSQETINKLNAIILVNDINTSLRPIKEDIEKANKILQEVKAGNKSVEEAVSEINKLPSVKKYKLQDYIEELGKIYGKNKKKGNSSQEDGNTIIQSIGGSGINNASSSEARFTYNALIEMGYDEEDNTLKQLKEKAIKESLEEFQKKQQELEDNLNKTQKEIDQNMSTFNSMVVEIINRLSAENQQLSSELSKLENEIPHITDPDEKVTKERRCEEIRQIIKYNEMTIDSLKYLLQINDDYKSRDNMSNELLEQKEKIEDQITDLEKKQSKLKGNAKKENEQKIKDLNSQLDSINKQLNELNEKMNVFDDELNNTLTKIKYLGRLQDSEYSELESIQNKINELENSKFAYSEAKESIKQSTRQINSIGSSGVQYALSSGKTVSGLQPAGEGKYIYYLMFHEDGVSETAQHQIKTKGAVKKNIDAENGWGKDVAGDGVHLELIPDGEIDLRTSISGVVWIDHDNDSKNENESLGIYDHEGSLDRPAAKNSVEVMVWKVLYEKNSGKEVERTKAVGWNLDGKEIDFMNSRIFINDEGKYSIDKIQIPSIEGLDTNKYTVSYDVEFIYDGQTYEATELLKATEKDTIKEKVAEFQKTAEETDGPNKDYKKYQYTIKNNKEVLAENSYVVENALEREQFDSYFTEVAGKEAIDDNGNTNGQASGGTDGAYYLQKDEKTDRTDKRTELQYTSTLSEAGTEGNRMRISNVVTTNDEGYVLDQYRFAARTSEARLRYPYENQYHVQEVYYGNLKFQQKEYKPVDEYFDQVNLGLLERYNSDISVLKDLYTAKVVVNEQETNYTFNSLEKLTNDSLTAEVDAYRTQKYTIGLYNSDYYYRSSVYSSEEDPAVKDIEKQIIAATKKNTELRLFVTYKIAITNQSELTDVSINEFKDYYDETFTLVNNEPTVASILDNNGDRHDKVVAETPFFRKLKAYDDSPEDKKTDLYRWNKAEDLVASGIDNGAIGEFKFNEAEPPLGNDNDKKYKGSKTNALSALKEDDNNRLGFDSKMSLEPGETMEVFVTYEVDHEGYMQATGQELTNGKSQERSNLLNEKSNIAEISNYSTAYTKESVARHKTTSYKEGNISGKIDRDSAPDNINMEKIGDANFIEDDTNFAPILTVELKPDTPRTLNGKVWEDSREDYKEADGKYDEKLEKGIKDIDVTLVEKIRIGKEDIAKYGGNLELLDYEFEFVWPDNAFGDKVPYTSRGKTSDDGDYQFQNFTAGNYVVRFEYGNSTETLKYNGQDYKNTAYQTEMTNTDKEIGTSNVPGNATLNNEWHDLSDNDKAEKLQKTRVSDARDYEPRRMKVIAYSRTITNKNAEVLAAYIDDADTNLTDNYKGKLKENEQELINNTAMVANTAKFNVEIEKQDSIAYKTVETTDGIQGHDSYEISNIDFGLVRRPETRINIKKEIASIGLYKNDGTEPILFVKMDDNGDIIKDDKNGINIDKITEIRKEDLGDGQGFKYIGMESSLLKGLKVQLNYKVTVENNSENDYVGKKLAKIKNIQELYDTVVEYETGINSTGEITKNGTNEDGLSAFSTGRGIIYGEWLGLYYYTNIPPDISSNNEEIKNNYGYQYDDEIVKTTIDQLADYVDNDLSIDKEEITYENRYWAESTDADRAQKFSMMSYKGDINNIDDIIKDENFVDNKGRAYVTTNNNNIWLSYNENMIETPVSYKKTYDNKESVNTTDNSKIIIPKLDEVEREHVYTAKQGVGNAVSTYNPVITQELKPGQNASINVVTSAQASEDIINNMNYDNLVEIVMYSNSVGRRDTETIPGNANMIAKYRPMYEAGYNYNYSESNRGYMTKEVKVDETADDLYRTVSETKQPITTERDAYAAKDTITFSEPTGLSIERETINKVISVILIGLLVTAVVIIIATVLIVIKKTKYDDGHLVKTDNKN